MKKLFFALAIVLSSVTATQAQSKIAHVNSETLLDTMPSRKKAIAEVQELRRRGDEELADLEQKLEKEYNEYLIRKPTQSPQMNQYDESRLMKMQQDAQAREQEITNLLQNMSTSLNEEILATVKEAVDIIAKKKGLNYVIDVSSTLYNSGTDITNEIIPELLRLDAEKQKKKAAAAAAGQ
jgi:outer membrane protein